MHKLLLKSRRLIEKINNGGLSVILPALKSKIDRKVKVRPVTLILNELLKVDKCDIVQLGAYVGKTTNDPIYSAFNKKKLHTGKLILVEPVPEFFKKLKLNYKLTEGVFLENVAISDSNDIKPFYVIGVDPNRYGYPRWLSQIGSLKAERSGEMWDQFEKDEHIRSFFLKHQKVIEVPCLTFTELAARHGLTHIDLLQIDTEGSEYDILTNIDFNQLSIRFINYERVLLGEKEQMLENLMTQNGYRLLHHGLDTFCYKATDDELIKRLGIRS